MEQEEENNVFREGEVKSRNLFFSKITICFPGRKKNLSNSWCAHNYERSGYLFCLCWCDRKTTVEWRSEAERMKPEKEQRSLTKITSVSFVRGCHCLKVLWNTLRISSRVWAPTKGWVSYWTTESPNAHHTDSLGALLIGLHCNHLKQFDHQSCGKEFCLCPLPNMWWGQQSLSFRRKLKQMAKRAISRDHAHLLN